MNLTHNKSVAAVRTFHLRFQSFSAKQSSKPSDFFRSVLTRVLVNEGFGLPIIRLVDPRMQQSIECTNDAQAIHENWHRLKSSICSCQFVAQDNKKHWSRPSLIMCDCILQTSLCSEYDHSKHLRGHNNPFCGYGNRSFSHRTHASLTTKMNLVAIIIARVSAAVTFVATENNVVYGYQYAIVVVKVIICCHRMLCAGHGLAQVSSNFRCFVVSSCLCHVSFWFRVMFMFSVIFQCSAWLLAYLREEMSPTSFYDFQCSPHGCLNVFQAFPCCCFCSQVSLLNLRFPNFSTFLASCFDIAHTFSVTPHFAPPPSAHKTEWNLIGCKYLLAGDVTSLFHLCSSPTKLVETIFFLQMLARWDTAAPHSPPITLAQKT